MFERFGALPPLRNEWFGAVEVNPVEVKKLIAAGVYVWTDDSYRDLEAQLLLTQDLSGECPGCGATVGAVCRTKTERCAARRPTSRRATTSSDPSPRSRGGQRRVRSTSQDRGEQLCSHRVASCR